jgi:hypothetical protein
VEDARRSLKQGRAVGFEQIRFHKLKRGTGEQRGEIRLFDRSGVIVGEAIDADHLFGSRVVEQAPAQTRANEARGARDKPSHDAPPGLSPRGVVNVAPSILEIYCF